MRIPTFSRHSDTEAAGRPAPTGSVARPDDETTTRFTTAGAAADRKAERADAKADRAEAKVDRAMADRDMTNRSTTDPAMTDRGRYSMRPSSAIAVVATSTA